jgi:23S rRNA (uridine2552-2'-O)-methyltransferase
VAAYTRKDAAYRAAQKEGFRSRAAIKLQEIDGRYRILRPGQRVVDLGAWPGGWLQVAAVAVGPRGLVVGVDLAPIEDLGLANVRTFVGDVADPDVRTLVRDAVGGRADLVLSDLAPKLSGVKVADRERHLALVAVALDYAVELLDDRGRLVIKLFGGVEAEATKLLDSRFGAVHKHRPSATRKGSSELYAIASKPRAGGR